MADPRRRAAERDFTELDLARARLIHDLKHNMGVNDEGLDVILHLIDQMHGLRRALAQALASMHERERTGRDRAYGLTYEPAWRAEAERAGRQANLHANWS